MTAVTSLFACTRCHSRHPFEELSQAEQLCKECRNNFPVVKCTYCRAEFQQEDKTNTNAICKKCTQNVKQYGKPTACELCNVLAAFIGNKCQKCTNSEKKWGPPTSCEQCKQMCAFKRDEESRRKVDGKLLCWLCTMTYKKVLAKTKKHDSTDKSKKNTENFEASTGTASIKKDLSHGNHHHGRHERSSSSSSRHKKDHHHSSKSRENKEQKSHHHHHHKSKTHHTDKKSHSHNLTPSKKPKLEKSTSNGVTPSKSEQLAGDPASTEHIIAITQLKEEVESLKKQIQLKDQQLLEKDKKLTELKAQNYETEKELRTKITNLQKQHTDALETSQAKNRQLAKQVASLTKSTKKIGSSSPSITL